MMTARRSRRGGLKHLQHVIDHSMDHPIMPRRDSPYQGDISDVAAGPVKAPGSFASRSRKTVLSTVSEGSIAS
jgi:hypothetical protein